MSHRDAFLSVVEAQLGKPVLWAQKGPDAFDCSGLVTYCLKQIGGQDLRHLENAQALHDHSRALGSLDADKPLPGDLAFYGVYEGPEKKLHVVHVAVVDHYGGVISADGATSLITSLHVALANPAHRVRRHKNVKYRKDTPYCVIHRFVAIDALDFVSR